MPKEALKNPLTPDPAPEPDNSEETETAEPREYLDPEKVVVSIRKGIEKMKLMNDLRNELDEKKGRLQYYLDFLDSSASNISSRRKEAEDIRYKVPTLKKRITKIEAELAELEAEKKI